MRAAGKPRAQPGLTDARLGRIVRLLSDHAMVVVSGTKLAQEIAASRSEVWRLVQRLRRLGVRIAGRPATGYQIESVPDLLLPEFLRPALKGTIFGEHIHHYFRIGSTNAAAMQAAADGAPNHFTTRKTRAAENPAPEGSVYVAEEQTAGRGRGGHGWHSARSAGIYCSVILRPRVAPADVLTLSLATGLAVREAVSEVTGMAADLRWPNDLLLGGKKFCGILIEMHAEATRVRHAVVGVGMNVNQESFPPSLAALATSLRMEDPSRRCWSRVELAAALLKSLDREYSRLDDPAAREEVKRRFEQHSSSARGRRVRVEEDGGYEGVTEGLDERGFLRVRTDLGLRTVMSGGVREKD
ncbi:MAG: biotin--[acetyl-CoA-carboxylase] ligase [Acidobacteriia bacterium]|nr:biotin--[acetyl-CoA-carboxylase] ligase [Terriglobia bacterium]